MGSKALKKGYMSIGKVVEILDKEFPTLSISKIRYLEDEKLIDPKRTKGGYRRFTQDDVDRLRIILKLQKDRYLPLRVIKEELKKLKTGRTKTDDLLGDVKSAMSAADVISGDGKRMTLDQAQEASGLTGREIQELEAYGLVKAEAGDKGPTYSQRNVQIMHLVKTLAKHGIQARHLKMYESFAERESTLLGQIVAPYLKQKSEDAKEKALQTLGDLTDISGELRQALLDKNLKDSLDLTTNR
jgi:DNA-binding transcriptional MerR regulator